MCAAPSTLHHIKLRVAKEQLQNQFPVRKGVLYLEKWSQKYNLTSGNVFNRLKYGQTRAAASRAVVFFDTCPSESNFILEKWIACQTRALTQHYKMRIRITGFKYLSVEEYMFAVVHAAAACS